MTEIMLKAAGIGLLALALGGAWCAVIVNRVYTKSTNVTLFLASLLFIAGFAMVVVCGTVALLTHAWGY